MERKYKVLVFGATGFTGKLCAKYLKENYPDLSWAIAGRNEDKLKQVKMELDLDCDMLIADANNYEELRDIAKTTKVLLTTAGPYAKYGSLLMKACVFENTHYVDITGENHWVKKQMDLYHEEAVARGVRIIPSCGYDSLPSDLGTLFAINKMNKAVKKVEVFHSAFGGASGGTIESIFTMGRLPKEMRDPFLLNPKGSVSERQRESGKDSIKIKWIDEAKKWSGLGLFAVANTRVVRRSAALMEMSQKPYGANFTFKEHGAYSSKSAARLATFGLIAAFLIISTPLKHLVRRFLPKPGEGPSTEIQEKGWFKGVFIAEAEDGEKQVSTIYGDGDPGYKSTSKMVCESALTIALCNDLPGGENFGGFLTPASGLGQPLIERLKNAGIRFH